jgi:hypothetical protein
VPGRALIDSRCIGSQDPHGSWLLQVRFVLIAGLVISWALHGAVTAWAHEGGEFGITIPVERVPPGADLPLVGAEWAADSFLEVRLQAGGSEFTTIGTTRTDNAGHFATALRLPESLPPGVAVIQVISTYGVLDTAVVTIDPAAPPPSLAPDIASATDTTAAGLDPVPFVALAGAVGALGLLVVRTRRQTQG